MEQIKRILPLEIKESAKAYLKFLITTFILSMIFFSYKASPDVKDFVISEKIIIACLITFFVLLHLVISTGKSMQDTFIMANKLGHSRKNITQAFIIKDLLLILVSALLIFILSSFMIKKAQLVSFIDNKDIENIINNLGGFANVLRICVIYMSFSNLFANIAYLVNSNPLSGSIFAILFLSFFRNKFIGPNGLIQSTIFALILFLFAQALRYYIINKVDAKS